MAQARRYDSRSNARHSNVVPFTRGNTAPKIEQKPSRTPLIALPSRMQSLKNIKEQVSVSNKKAIKIYASIVLVALLFAFAILGRVQLDEVNREIANTERKIEIASSKNVELNMKLNEMVSIEKVEDYAVNNLGMVKVQDYQVVYVDLSDNDRVLMPGGKETAETKTVTQVAGD